MKNDVAVHHDIPAICPNCDIATTGGNYCQNCGQETRMHAPSFSEFAHEFIGHYVALEGRLWGTFTRLLFRPGLLTLEYMRGRRKRYVEPLRMYLTLSVLFFALLKFTSVEPVKLDGNDTIKVKEHAADIRDEIIRNGRTVDAHGNQIELPDTLRAKAPGLAKQVDHFSDLDTAGRGKVLSDGFFNYGPYAMFALMPLFALYLKFLYLGSGKRYGEHLLFALHSSAFAFVLFAAIKLTPDGLIQFAEICWLVGYLPWAMRRVYGGSRWATFLRWSLLMLAHCLSMAIAIGIAVGMGVATAH
ncbi:hypothetical protein GCM10027277_15260 [Pseudoduganella ginsengisoli]|uniref:DUF3667 domain-containing protein n=1 Tax=Pseudoduganella ginsengisoli TaxID=1462440 RepID=A0A6L6PUK6_9BURK|nr:DUF3667 domain-containing protein [Pseudoduganella ginsengisoli]MTW01213.1 DUF3667 domain-containing protein [Pseudoduganella ginsengisoli]